MLRLQFEMSKKRSICVICYWLFVIPPRRICKDPGPEDPALSSPQRGGVYLGLQME
ncbi:hypothetical protein D1AOALGA4SA_3300 [Olavius algarvensis Delta 1 endosymbiont]|nr:hypothetical protein D1AOALGA4SA_3300 [Olavius algarvensis Delta 1 endosymbiont]